MAKYRLLLTVVLLTAACNNPAAARPATSPLIATPSVSSPSTAPASPRSFSDPEQLRYVRMTSLGVVWAGTSRRLLRSTDRGRSWVDVTPNPPTRWNGFFALDDDAAWISAGSVFGKPSLIAHTTDAGRTWSTRVLQLATGAIGSVMFVDRLHGWALVDRGAAAGSQSIAVIRSSDGGDTWTQVAETSDPTTGAPSASGLSFGCDKGAVTFGTQTVGLLPLDCAGGVPAIYRSADGGLHWVAVGLPSLGGQPSFSNPIFLTQVDVVMVAYNASSLTLLSSHDAGQTWRAQPLPGAGSVDFESVTSGWQLNARVSATADAGATWHAVGAATLPFDPQQTNLQDLGKGIAVASSSVAVYRTDDGAMTWANITPRLAT